MIYPIQNFLPFVPMGAQYVGVVGESNGVFTVRYYHDERGLSEASNYVSHSGKVVDEEVLKVMIGERNFVRNVAAAAARTVGRFISAAVNICNVNGRKCKVFTFIVATEDDAHKNSMDEETRWSTVAELVFPEDQVPSKGDKIEIYNSISGKSERVLIIELIGEGKAKDFVDEITDFYDGDFNPDEVLSEDPAPGFLIRVDGEEMTGEDNDFAVDPEEQQESAMPKLKDTTKAAGQAKQKLRRGDKAKGQIDDEEYVDDGDDARGIMRFPHSDLEKQFADLHGKPEFMDHPARTDRWAVQVTNREIGSRMKSANEDIAPLSSDDYFFFSNDLNEYSTYTAKYPQKNQTFGEFDKDIDKSANKKMMQELNDTISRSGHSNNNLYMMWDFSYNNGRIVKAKDYVSGLKPHEREKFNAHMGGSSVSFMKVEYLSNTYYWRALKPYMPLSNGMPPADTMGTVIKFGKIGKVDDELTKSAYLYPVKSRRNKPFSMLGESFLEDLNSGKKKVFIDNDAQTGQIFDKDDTKGKLDDVFVKHMP